MEECVEVIFSIDSDVSDSEDFQPEFLYDGDRAIKEEEDSPQFDIPLPNITGTESSGVGPVSQVTSPSENSGEELPGQAILPLAEENGTYSKPVPISPANRIQSPGVVPLIDRTIRDPNVAYKVEQSSSGGVDPVYRVISATCPSGNSALQAEKEHPGQATLPLVSGSPGVVPLINRSIRDPKVFYKVEESSSGGVGKVYRVLSAIRPSENSALQVEREHPGQATLPLVDENRTDSKPVLVSPANRVQSPGVVPLIDRTIRDPNVVYKVEQSSSGGVDPVYRVISATCPTGNSALQVEKEHPGQATLPLVSGSPGVVPLINRSIRDPKVFYKVEESSSGGVGKVYRVLSAIRPSENSALQVEREHPGLATLPLVDENRTDSKPVLVSPANRIQSPGVVPLIDRTIRDPNVAYKVERSSSGGVGADFFDTRIIKNQPWNGSNHKETSTRMVIICDIVIVKL